MFFPLCLCALCGDVVMALRIKNWNDHYERGESRKLKEMTWLPLPLKQGSGYRRVLAQTDGPALFGAWIAIAEFAAKCPVRGLLVRRSGRPYKASDIAITQGFPVDLITRACQLLIDPDAEIEWLEEVSDDFAKGLIDDKYRDNSRENPPDNSETSGESPSEPPKTGGSREKSGEVGSTGQEKTKKNRTGRIGSDPESPEQSKSAPSPASSAQPPVRSSMGEPVTWAEAAEAMKGLKVSKRQDAIAAAKANGFTPPAVLAIVDYLRTVPPSDCVSPAGALFDRLNTPDAAEWDATAAWPWSRPGQSAEVSPYVPSAAAEQQHKDRLEREKLERKRKYLADVERRELAFGQQLNAMGEPAVLQMIGADAILTKTYLAKGRDSPDVRPMLLQILEKVHHRDHGEAQSENHESVDV